MMSRFLNIFTANSALWRLTASASPAQLLISLLALIIAPYLVYVFWGSVVVFILAGVGLWVLIRFIRRRMRRVSS